jgi:hypothetical protein
MSVTDETIRRLNDLADREKRQAAVERLAI